MPGEKHFRTSLFGGYKKMDVNIYVEKIIKEYDEKMKTKDDEISALRNQNRELKAKCEELSKKTDEVTETRSKIADVLIQAQEKAEKILENARLESVEERKKIEVEIEKEKEKLVDIRTEIKGLKNEIVRLLRKYEQQLSSLTGDEKEQAESEAAASSLSQDTGMDTRMTDETGYSYNSYDSGYIRY